MIDAHTERELILTRTGCGEKVRIRRLIAAVLPCDEAWVMSCALARSVTVL